MSGCKFSNLTSNEVPDLLLPIKNKGFGISFQRSFTSRSPARKRPLGPIILMTNISASKISGKVRRRIFHAVRFGDRFVSDFAIHHVDSAEQCRLLRARFCQSVIREHFNVSIGHVRQRLRRRARIRARHVRHAIMRHAFLDKDRIVMRRGPRSFRASALIDRNIHQHAAGTHPPQHFAPDQLRRPGARHQAPRQSADPQSGNNSIRCASFE